MNQNKSISVCMASYNGAMYIDKQIMSILKQLTDNDELIIVDDCSSDQTVNIINSFNDHRIKLHINSYNSGVVKSFEKAISYAVNNTIYLSDQDDIWYDNKVAVVNEAFMKDEKISLVLSNAEIIDKNGDTSHKLFYNNDFKGSFLRNLKSNNFLGCCIAFKKDSIKGLFPFPEKIPMHDYWIGLNHILYGHVFVIDQPLIGYRRHGGNATTGKRSKILNVLKWRYILIKSLIISYFKREK